MLSTCFKKIRFACSYYMKVSILSKLRSVYYFFVLKSIFSLCFSLSPVTKWRGSDIRAAISSHSQSRPVDMRHNGNTAPRDSMGLQVETGELPREPLSSSHDFIEGIDCDLWSVTFTLGLQSSSIIYNSRKTECTGEVADYTGLYDRKVALVTVVLLM